MSKIHFIPYNQESFRNTDDSRTREERIADINREIEKLCAQGYDVKVISIECDIRDLPYAAWVQLDKEEQQEAQTGNELYSYWSVNPPKFAFGAPVISSLGTSRKEFSGILVVTGCYWQQDIGWMYALTPSDKMIAKQSTPPIYAMEQDIQLS
jgi:hypothetical protein